MPADYERRQTLAGAERYVTPELKEYEAKVLGAEERMATREAELFARCATGSGTAIARIQRTARVLARLDVWAGLAEVAEREPLRPARRWTTASRSRFAQSRHPVIERLMPRETFMPNDVRFERGGAGAAGDRPQHGRQVAPSCGRSASCVVLAQIG